MLSPEAFRDRYEGELDDELPNSPISSLRDIQYLYGKLYTLATAGNGEYTRYLTPYPARHLTDTDDSLIVVRVDLSGDEPRLADEDDERDPVWVTRYTGSLIRKVAHCKYSASRGIDHSVTHQAGQNSQPEKLARYAKQRLTKWATDEVVQSTAEEHEQREVINALAKLGRDENTLSTIEESLKDRLGGESTTALLTVQVKLDNEGDYLWPGELNVFMDAMRERKRWKLISKNEATDSSGISADLISGDNARTVGTPDVPQNYYLAKQQGTFPGLNPDEAWRTHPISEESAVAVVNAEEFVEACTYRTLGAKVYYLPYFFGTPTAEEAFKLYSALYRAATEDERMTPVERAYLDQRGKKDSDDSLHFYVSAVIPHQTSRYDVFGETLSGRLMYPKTLATEHNRITQTSLFAPSNEWTGPLPSIEDWELLSGGKNMLDSVSTGWYFAQTFAERDDDQADADDPRIEALIDVLSGDGIAVETLLSEYVDRIIVEENDDDNEGFPSLRVASQFAQLCALATDELDLLKAATPETESVTTEPSYETHTMTTSNANPIADGGNPAATKLESFIENTPAFDHDERRGAFLLGALVGAVGNYQDYYEDRSTTVIDQYPVKSVTSTRIKKVTQETISKALTYTRKEKKSGTGYPGTKFQHIVDPLRETIVNPDPDDWDIGTDDLRFYYALGVTYGLNDRPTSSDTNENAVTEVN